MSALDRIGEVIAARPPDPEPGPSALLEAMPELAEHDRKVAATLGDRRAGAWPDVILDRFVNARLSDLDVGVAEPLRVWVASPSNLLLTGPVGTGKSHAAAAACYELWTRGTEIIAYELDVLLDLMDWRRPEASTVVDMCATVPVLLLDDLGAKELSAWALDRVSRIGAERWRRCLPTVITTNLEPDQLEAHIGERLFSRLADDALAVAVSGPDRRRQR